MFPQVNQPRCEVLRENWLHSRRQDKYLSISVYILDGQTIASVLQAGLQARQGRVLMRALSNSVFLAARRGASNVLQNL